MAYTIEGIFDRTVLEGSNKENHYYFKNITHIYPPPAHSWNERYFKEEKIILDQNLIPGKTYKIELVNEPQHEPEISLPSPISIILIDESQGKEPIKKNKKNGATTQKTTTAASLKNKIETTKEKALPTDEELFKSIKTIIEHIVKTDEIDTGIKPVWKHWTIGYSEINQLPQKSERGFYWRVKPGIAVGIVDSFTDKLYEMDSRAYEPSNPNKSSFILLYYNQ